jgi:hypothetical protein
MYTIGIIDDRDSVRRSFARKIELRLSELFNDWSVIQRKPFIEREDYTQWILENEITVLIIDERLNEEAIKKNKVADYYGHDLAIDLRKRFKELPVYSITSHKVTPSLKKAFKNFNLILNRREFDEEIDMYLNLFVKSGEDFFAKNQKQLGRLGELSEKIAKGTASQKNKDEALAIQTNLQLPHLTEDLQNREEFLKDLEANLNQLKKMQSELSKLLNSK